MAKINCFLYNTILETLKTREDGFVKFFDINGRELILFNYKHNLFIPNCIKIPRVEVVQTFNICYNKFEIRFIQNNLFERGFLLSNGIIVKEATKISCDEQFNYMILEKKKQILIGKNNSISISNMEMDFIDLHPEMFKTNELNFNHNYETLRGIDDPKNFKIVEYKSPKFENEHIYTQFGSLTSNLNFEGSNGTIYILFWITITSFIIIILGIFLLIFIKLKLKYRKQSPDVSTITKGIDCQNEAVETLKPKTTKKVKSNTRTKSIIDNTLSLPGELL